ncbi:hypothetical protein ES703_99919 [subsurface metagenome]
MPTVTLYPSFEGGMKHNENNFFNPNGVSWATLIASAIASEVWTTSGYLYWNCFFTHPSEPPNKWMVLDRSIFVFDTSSLPDDCLITSAVLRLSGYLKHDYLSIDPDINIYEASPAADDDLEVGDFDCIGSVALCDTPVAYADWGPLWVEFNFNAVGISKINKQGNTRFGTRCAKYDVAGVAPPWVYIAGAFGYTDMRCRSSHYSGGANKPELVITYVFLPAVTTNPASSIAGTAAILNGTLDDDTGEVCACGFEWGETVAYGNTTPTQSKTTGQTFSRLITGLSLGTIYHFRAFATNLAGTSYGADRAFTTRENGLSAPIKINRAFALSREEL